ncbi:MAG TPA: ArsR family transcriptional regulator, partial [Candidatus Methanoperedens sp.]
MKSNENRYLWTQIEIVKTLLDGSKKTQNQIAKETDYDKSTISHAMDDLDKNNIIKRQSKEKESGNRNKGRYKNKLCWLNFEMDNGSEILRFFNNILKSKKLKQQETS